MLHSKSYNFVIAVFLDVITWHTYVILPFLFTLTARFQDGRTNVLVASEVLEEGIDIQKCNLVVKFDTPNNYRSYIQSKGRARSRSSHYYIMVSRHKQKTFDAAYQNYRYTENALREVSTKLEAIFT
jgi:ERCC4-related helicase